LLVVVVHGDGEDLLGTILADHPLVELVEDALGWRNLGDRQLLLGRAGLLFLNDLAAQIDALVADIHATGPRDEAVDLLLALAAVAAAILHARGPPAVCHPRGS